MSAHALMGAVPFPLFEDKEGWEGVVPKGVVLRLRSIDLALLQDELGELNVYEFGRKLEGCSIRMMWACLKHGLKKPGGSDPVLLNQKMLDDLPFGPAEATPFVGDLLAMVYSGKTFDELKAMSASAEKTTLGEEEPTLDGGAPLAVSKEPSTLDRVQA